MSIFDIDFSIKSEELIPPDKREGNLLSIVKAVLKSLQWSRDVSIGSFKDGTSYPLWSAGSFGLYDTVEHNKSIWYSLVSGNTEVPGVGAQWLKIQNDFIGIDERIQYDGKKLMFEWALNRWFKTTFRQPTAYEMDYDNFYSPKSDIFLITTEIPLSVFRAGINESESSSVGYSDSSEAVYDDYDFSVIYGLTINIPNAVYLALSADMSTRQNIVRNFADKYVTKGVFYDIKTY